MKRMTDTVTAIVGIGDPQTGLGDVVDVVDECGELVDQSEIFRRRESDVNHGSDFSPSARSILTNWRRNSRPSASFPRNHVGHFVVALASRRYDRHTGTTSPSVYCPPRESACTQSRCSATPDVPQYAQPPHSSRSCADCAGVRSAPDARHPPLVLLSRPCPYAPRRSHGTERNRDTRLTATAPAAIRDHPTKISPAEAIDSHHPQQQGERNGATRGRRAGRPHSAGSRNSCSSRPGSPTQSEQRAHQAQPTDRPHAAIPTSPRTRRSPTTSPSQHCSMIEELLRWRPTRQRRRW